MRGTCAYTQLVLTKNMPQITVQDRIIPVDNEGYLAELSDWDESVAEYLASEAGITLTDSHWDIIALLKRFYATYDHAPNNRILVKHVQQHRGKEIGNSIYLMQLFNGTPAKTAAKIAGLPRPTNCL